MNKVILIGNLTENPKLITTANAMSRCGFRMAVQRNYVNQATGQRDADFFSIVAWRGTAERCAQYLSKGSKCAVVGSIHTRDYADKDGNKRTITEIQADEVQFLFSAKKQGAEEQPALSAGSFPGGYTPVVDDDMPF